MVHETEVVHRTIISNKVAWDIDFSAGNSVYDYNSLLQFLVAYGVGADINVQYVPVGLPPQEFKEPPLNKGQVPKDGSFVDSTVTVKQVTKDLKPLVKRLVELNEQAKLIPQSFGNNLLTTFDVQPGGSPLNPKAVTDAFLTGTTTSSEKFKNNLNKLLPNSASPDSLKGVVKVLVEYLIDNYVYDINSLVQFLAAYGVGSEIDVQYIQMKTKPADAGKEPALQPAKVPANMRVESSVGITQVLADLKPLVKRLVDLNVQAKNIPQSVANNLLATFNVQAGGSPLSAAMVGLLQIGGQVEAAKKFTKGLVPLVGKASDPNSLRGLVDILTELLIDNANYDHNSLLQFLVFYGVGAQVQIQYIPFGGPRIASNFAGTEGFDLKAIAKEREGFATLDLKDLKLKVGSGEAKVQGGVKGGFNLDALRLKGGQSGQKKQGGSGGLKNILRFD